MNISVFAPFDFAESMRLTFTDVADDTTRNGVGINPLAALLNFLFRDRLEASLLLHEEPRLGEEDLQCAWRRVRVQEPRCAIL